MLLLYTRLLDRQNSSSSLQKNHAKADQTNIHLTTHKNSRIAHQDVAEHFNQVKTNYSLHRRFVL